jgi:ElaB/YqjD/DUF883 family membrane-anchored ribosome-binding protein
MAKRVRSTRPIRLHARGSLAVPRPEKRMNKQVEPSLAAAANTVTAAERIEDRADRVKQATSNAVEHTKDVVDRAADKVESGLHRATDKAAAGATRAAEKANEATDRAREVYDDARERTDEWLDTAREYVREKPIQSIAIALAAGWVAGRILRS